MQCTRTIASFAKALNRIYSTKNSVSISLVGLPFRFGSELAHLNQNLTNF